MNKDEPPPPPPPSQFVDDVESVIYEETPHIPTRASGPVITKYSGCYVIQRLLQIIFCFKKLNISLSNYNIKTCFNLFWSNNCMFADSNEVIWPNYWIKYNEAKRAGLNLKLIDYIRDVIKDQEIIDIYRLTGITNTSNSQDKKFLIDYKYVSVLADSKYKVDEIDGIFQQVIELITITADTQQSIASCMLAVENDVIHYFSVKSSTDQRWIDSGFIQFITGWVDDKFTSDAHVFYIPAIFIKMLFISIQEPNETYLDEEILKQVQTYYIPAKMENPTITQIPIDVSAISDYCTSLNEHGVQPKSNILFFAWFFETYMLYEGIGVSAPWPVDLGVDTLTELKKYKRENPAKNIGPIQYDFKIEKTNLILKMCKDILSNKSISILLMNGYRAETYTETMMKVIKKFREKGAFNKNDEIKTDAAVAVAVDDAVDVAAVAVAAVGEDIADVLVLEKYISTRPVSSCSDSTSGCSADKVAEKSNQPSTKRQNTFLPQKVLKHIEGFLDTQFTGGGGETHTRKRNNRKPRTKKQFRHQSKKANKNIKVKPNNRTNYIRQNNKKPFKKIV